MSFDKDFQKYLTGTDGVTDINLTALTPLNWDNASDTISIDNAAIITASAQTWQGEKTFDNDSGITLENSNGKTATFKVDVTDDEINITQNTSPVVNINKSGGYSQSVLDLNYEDSGNKSNSFISNSSGLIVSSPAGKPLILDNALLRHGGGPNNVITNLNTTDLTHTYSGSNYNQWNLSAGSSGLYLATTTSNYARFNYTFATNDLNIVVNNNGNIIIDDSNRFYVNQLFYSTTAPDKYFQHMVSPSMMLSNVSAGNISLPQYIQLSDGDWIDAPMYQDNHASSTSVTYCSIYLAFDTTSTGGFRIDYRVSYTEPGATAVTGSTSNQIYAGDGTLNVREFNITNFSSQAQRIYSVKVTYTTGTYTGTVKCYGVRYRQKLFGW